MLIVRRKADKENKVKFYKELEKETSKVFFKYHELAFFVFVVLLISFALFPKGEIERYIEVGKEYNVDLTIVYLKELSRASTDYEQKVKYENLLIRRLISVGKEEEAINRINELAKLGISEWDLALMSYYLLKQRYFQNRESKEKIEEKLNQLYILSKGDEDRLRLVLEESVSMYVPSVSYRASYELYKLTKDKKMAQLAYSYAAYFKDQKVLQELSDFLGIKQVASTIELEDLKAELKRTSNKVERRKLFIEALKLAIAKQRYDVVEQLVDDYGKEFIGDKEVEYLMVKYLLMAGKPEKAGELVRKLFAKENR